MGEKMKWQNNIKKYRNAKGLTQKQLAELIKDKRENITGWETGRAKPSVEKLSLLAQALGVSLEALVSTSPPKASTKAPFPPYAQLPVEPGQTVAETIKGYRSR